MRLRAIILVLLVLVMAGGTYYLANEWLKSERAALSSQATTAPAPKTGTYVLVAARSLPSGEFVTPSAVRWQSWPDNDVPSNYVISRDAPSKNMVAAVTGAVIRAGLAAGQPLTQELLVRPGQRGFLAAVLWPGMRAISVPVTVSSGLAGLLFPGDRIDLILTQRIRVDAPNGKSYERRGGETILRNVRVLAIDQRTDDQNKKPGIGKVVTLEVMPKQAEIVAVALEMGVINLALRSLSPKAAGERYTASGQPKSGQPKSGQPKSGQPTNGRKTAPATGAADPLIRIRDVRPNARDADPVRPKAAKPAEIKPTELLLPKKPVPTTLLRHKVPSRGLTSTPDHEVSRLLSSPNILGRKDKASEVMVVRGGKAEKVSFHK